MIIVHDETFAKGKNRCEKVKKQEKRITKEEKSQKQSEAVANRHDFFSSFLLFFPFLFFFFFFPFLFFFPFGQWTACGEKENESYFFRGRRV